VELEQVEEAQLAPVVLQVLSIFQENLKMFYAVEFM
jgi:hypothetical protein